MRWIGIVPVVFFLLLLFHGTFKRNILGFMKPIFSLFTKELFPEEETNKENQTTKNDDAASYWDHFFLIIIIPTLIIRVT